MSPSEDKLTEILLDIKEDIGQQQGSLISLHSRMTIIETNIKTNIEQGCRQAQANKAELEKFDKKLTKVQGIVYSISAVISGVMAKFIN